MKRWAGGLWKPVFPLYNCATRAMTSVNSPCFGACPAADYQGTGTLFIVNDRPDIAFASQADGVHLGQDDLPAAEARKLIGTAMLLGLSTHNLKQVAAANDAPVDYIGFGPLFATNSKERPDPVTGPDALKAALAISRHPVVAIGGLNLDRIRRLQSSPHNVAVIRAVSDAPDPLTAMRAIHAICLDVKL